RKRRVAGLALNPLDTPADNLIVIKGEPRKLVHGHELDAFWLCIAEMIERHHRKVGDNGRRTAWINIARKPCVELLKMRRFNAELVLEYPPGSIEIRIVDGA